MAQSFFERLTGSIRGRDDADDDRDDGRASPGASLLGPGAKHVGRREPDAGRHLHPVAVTEDDGMARAGEAEEGELTVDIYDDGTHLVVQSTVAGVRPEDVDIALEENTLTIRGFRKRQQDIADDQFFCREVYWGSFSRSIILPEEVDFQKVDASIKNGLLTIRLPKKDRGTKKIRVKASD